MVSFLEHVRNDFTECLSDSCSKEHCSLILENIRSRSRAIVDLDKYQLVSSHSGPIADYIVFTTAARSELVIAVIELKRGSADLNEARNQIQAGALIGEGILDSYDPPLSSSIRFLPILLSKSVKSAGFKTRKRKPTEPERVLFRNSPKPYTIIMKRCGASLAEIMSKYS